jgi:uncharacterized protein DUF4259
MGSWGYAVFQSDGSCDWATGFAAKPSKRALGAAFRELGAAGSGAEDRIAEAALGAAEVVAALNGEPSKHLPSDLAKWVAGRPAPSARLIANARKAVWSVWESSECREVWDDSGALYEWGAELDDLLERLGEDLVYEAVEVQGPRSSRTGGLLRKPAPKRAPAPAGSYWVKLEGEKKRRTFEFGPHVGSKERPPVGSVYAFPMRDGYVGVCRVIREDNPGPKGHSWSVPASVVVATTWAERDPPASLKSPELRKLLSKLCYPGWREADMLEFGSRYSMGTYDLPHAFVLGGSPPSEFELLGTLQPTKQERAIQSWTAESWKVWGDIPLEQALWSRKRRAFVDDYEPLPLPRGTKPTTRLRALLKLDLFGRLEGVALELFELFPPDSDIERTVSELIELGDAPSKQAVHAVLKRGVEEVSEKDGESRLCGEFGEVEHLFLRDVFRLLATACGFPPRGGFDRLWRKWAVPKY